MNHRKAIVLPARLVGVVAQGTEAPAPPPVVAPRPEPVVSPDERDRAAVRELLAKLTEAVRQLAAARQRLPLDELRQAAVELGMAVAARLIHARIAAGDFGIEQLVRDALDQLPGREPAVVRLHPEDVALLERRLNGDLAVFHADRALRLQPDPTLGRGDCRVQAGDLSVWSSLRAQLAEARALLLEGLPVEE